MTAMRSGLRKGPLHARARSLTVLASIIGRKHGVRVVFRSCETASTDGKTIYLPTLSADATEEDAVLVEGLLDHEAGHCRFTDFEFVKTQEVQDAIRSHALVHPTWNTFEDVWMEREQSKVYPGCFRNIKKSVEVMIDRGLYGSSIERKVSAADAFRGFLLHALLGRLYENQRLIDFGIADRAKLEDVIGKQLTEAIWKKALEVDAVKTTKSCFALALEIFELIKSELEKEQQSKKSSQEKKDALLNIMNEKPQQGDIADMISAALNARQVTDASNPDLPTLYDIRPTKPLDPLQAPDLQLLARPIAAKLGSRLEVLLEARTLEETSFGRSGRRLDSGRVAGLALGNLSVFVTREEGVGLDTAVTILGDFSGSMYPNSNVEEVEAPHVVAKTSMMAMGDVLDRFEVPFSIVAYGTNIMEIKPFDASWRKSKSVLNQDELGSTYTAEALHFVAEQMVVRKESRRLVMLLTDGESSQNSLVVAAMNEMSRLGIEFSCIFIGAGGSELAQEIAEEGYRVQRTATIQELPQAMFDAIRDAM